jgi:regulator of protease activity HflC (stomatin/prohibitin superfamily)
MAKTRASLKDDAESGSTRREWLEAQLDRIQFTTYTLLVLFLIAVGYFWPKIFIVVPAGQRGVMFRYFKGGTVKDRIWGEGLNITPPWDSLSLYDIRLQQNTLKLQVLSEDGLTLGVSVAVSYRLNQEMLGYLQQDIGADYFDRMIRPQVESHARRIFGERSAHQIYSSAGEVLHELGNVPRLGGFVPRDGSGARPYLDILELKLLSVELPKVVENAIADKYRQEQLMLEYRYKLEREQKESERKRTEAAGIRDYVVISGLNPLDLLRWRSIEAAQELAKSNNTKILLLGGQNGLPVMLNIGDGKESSLPAAGGTAGSSAPATKTAETPTQAPPPIPLKKEAPAVKSKTAEAAQTPPSAPTSKDGKDASAPPPAVTKTAALQDRSQ